MPTLNVGGLTYMTLGTDEYGNPINENNAFAPMLFKHMLENGFEEVAKDASTISESKKVILRPTLAVDPNWTTDPWHVYFEVKGTATITNPLNPSQLITVQDRGLFMRVGSPTQLPNIAGISTVLPEYPIVPSQYYRLTAAELSSVSGITVNYPRVNINAPMEFKLAIYERGFALIATSTKFLDDMAINSVVCVQRGVSCDGTVSTTGQKPLYLVTNVSATGSRVYNSQSSPFNIDGPRVAWFYNVIREADTTAPYPSWTAYSGDGSPNITDGSGSNSWPANANVNLNYVPTVISDPREILGQTLNYFPTRWFGPVTNDTNEYIMLFPFGLCTDRFAFSEEIDLIAISKADAFQAGQSVPISVYGESRTYTATTSNNVNVNNDSGIRVFILDAEG